jgi:hypothetical protein
MKILSIFSVFCFFADHAQIINWFLAACKIKFRFTYRKEKNCLFKNI